MLSVIETRLSASQIGLTYHIGLAQPVLNGFMIIIKKYSPRYDPLVFISLPKHNNFIITNTVKSTSICI